MKKPASIENYVEFIALGLGGLFFLFMAYCYVVADPVIDKVVVNGQPVPVTPLTVDTVIQSRIAVPLQNHIRNDTPPEFKIENMEDKIPDGLGFKHMEPAPLADVFRPLPLMLPTPTTTPPPNPDAITELPVPPQAMPLFVEVVRSTVMLPAPGAAPAAVGPGAGPGPGFAGIPGGGPGGPGAAVPTEPTDVDVITGVFSIPFKPLNDAWVKAFGPNPGKTGFKLPEAVLVTEFLQVELVRQEWTGKAWGSDVVVKRLPNNNLAPMPDDTATMPTKVGFANWAPLHVVDITTPAFPAAAPPPAGQIWKDPLPIMQAAIIPGAGGAGGGAPGGGGGVPGGSGGAGGGGVPGGGGAPFIPLGMRPPGAPPIVPVRPPVAPPVGAGAGAAPDATAPKILPAPLVLVPPLPAAVANSFNPATVVPGGNTDILVYMHDMSVEPGKKYRYRLCYWLKNPLLNTNANVSDKAWLTQLGIKSADDAANLKNYSPEVTIDPRIYFFCAQQGELTRAGKFAFDVFAWAQGHWQMSHFDVSPGEMIGGIKNKVDYSTGVFLVDCIKRASNKVMVVMVDSNGNVTSRDATTDVDDAVHRKMTSEVNAFKPAGTP